MQESEEEFTVRPRVDLAVEHIDEDVVVLDKKNGQIHQLNHTASIVWKGIAAGYSKSTIVTNMVDLFDVSEDKADEDVKELFDQFKSLNLLESE